MTWKGNVWKSRTVVCLNFASNLQDYSPHLVHHIHGLAEVSEETVEQLGPVWSNWFLVSGRLFVELWMGTCCHRKRWWPHLGTGRSSCRLWKLLFAGLCPSSPSSWRQKFPLASCTPSTACAALSGSRSSCPRACHVQWTFGRVSKKMVKERAHKKERKYSLNK